MKTTIRSLQAGMVLFFITFMPSFGQLEDIGMMLTGGVDDAQQMVWRYAENFGSSAVRVGRAGEPIEQSAFLGPGEASDPSLELAVGRGQALRQFVEHAKGMFKVLRCLCRFCLQVAHVAESRCPNLSGRDSAKHVPSREFLLIQLVNKRTKRLRQSPVISWPR